MLALVLGCAWLLGPPIQRPGAAEPIALDWQAPPSCPSEDDVLDRLTASMPAGASESLSVRATIEASESSFVVALTLTNGDGSSERSFAARDCSTLTDAIVLVVAVTLDPVAIAEQIAVERAHVETEPTPTPELPAPKDPAITENPEITTGLIFPNELEPEPVRPRLRLRFGLRALGGGGYGPTRGGHGQVGGALAVLGQRWRVELVGLWAFPRLVLRPDEIGGTFEGWMLGGRGCFVPTAARVIELPVCAGVELGQVVGRGIETLPRVETADFVWAAASLGQGLWWAVSRRLAIGVELDLVVPFIRGSFLVDDLEVERVAAIGVRGLAGIEVRLP